MGYNTQFKGSLLFTRPITSEENARLLEIFGEDCREHPEWGHTHLSYMDLESNDDNTGIQWDYSEKTYDLVQKINLLITLMCMDYPTFGLKGELLAQGEDFDDLWKIVINDTGYAERREMRMSESSNIEQLSRNLINYVVEKYDVKNYDDFTCPHHKKLAEALKIF